MLKLTYCLGLRPSETTHLVIDDIRLQDGIVHIRETKFYKSRIVPFGEEVSRMLEDYLLWRSEIALRRCVSDNHLFIDKRGNPVQLSSFQQAFRLIREKAGIHRSDTAYPDVRLQDLRHTFATRLLEKGVDIKTISELLGHSSPTITLNRYVHTNIQNKRKAMEILTKKSAKTAD